MPRKKRVRVSDVTREYGLPQDVIVTYIAQQWLFPVEHAEDWQQCLLDEEDIARALLIRDLQEYFDVNDEAIPLILHLLDQIHAMRAQWRKSA